MKHLKSTKTAAKETVQTGEQFLRAAVHCHESAKHYFSLERDSAQGHAESTDLHESSDSEEHLHAVRTCVY